MNDNELLGIVIIGARQQGRDEALREIVPVRLAEMESELAVARRRISELERLVELGRLVENMVANTSLECSVPEWASEPTWVYRHEGKVLYTAGSANVALAEGEKRTE